MQVVEAIWHGAGEGNRTLILSLGSFCSAIELHPRRALLYAHLAILASLPGT
jgi:hypothetical protein